MLVPVILIGAAGSGLAAGPDTTEPSLTLNWLPWQGQSMVPLETAASEAARAHRSRQSREADARQHSPSAGRTEYHVTL
jgi:hypothetical protein